MKNNKADDVQVPIKITALCGGVAGMIASTAAHPFDLVKVRLQLMCKDCSTFEMTRDIVVHDGFKALWSGVSAALFRQATYTTVRLGTFSYLYDNYKRQYNQDPTVLAKMGIGVCSGLFGAFAGTPSEVVLVRMMADGPHYPCYCQRKYKGIIHALTRISNEEGFTSLWRGGVPTLIRSILVSTAQLGTYSQVREMMLAKNMKDDIYAHTYASIIASFATAVASLPADNIKTRSQNSMTKTSNVQMLREIIRDEGLAELWKGFTPYYQRQAILTILTIVLSDQLQQFYVKLCVANIAKCPSKTQHIKEKVSHIKILREVIKTEGVVYLWKGFWPYFQRLSLHTVLTFVIFEESIQYYKDYVKSLK